jgi:hypothetical protein
MVIFSAKGQAYYEVSGEPADWQDILRFHIVLGTIFENEGIWGPESEPRSAVFQWEHAALAEKKARQRDHSLPPSPGVHSDPRMPTFTPTVHRRLWKNTLPQRKVSLRPLVCGKQGMRLLGQTNWT